MRRKIGVNGEYMWFEMIMKALQENAEGEFYINASWDVSQKTLRITWQGTTPNEHYRYLLGETFWTRRHKCIPQVETNSAVYVFKRISVSLHRHLEQACELLNGQFAKQEMA